jgi:prephenate dehydrogenase
VLFERCAVVGVGLIGGSLAWAARRAGTVGEVVGVGRSEANLATARRMGIVDRTTTELAAIGPVDLAVLAVPVRSTAAIAQALRPHLKAGTVVTDVGSVKGAIVESLEPICLPDCPFVGTHPIAGSERSGAAAAQADLFEGSRCVVTPTAQTDADAQRRIEDLWRGVGAEIVVMSAEQHDRTLAWTSHLVHAISYALAKSAGDNVADLVGFAGPSLRDATRVAASSPALWRDIFFSNTAAVLDTIDGFQAELQGLRDAIESGDEAELMKRLDRAGAARALIEKRR